MSFDNLATHVTSEHASRPMSMRMARPPFGFTVADEGVLVAVDEQGGACRLHRTALGWDGGRLATGGTGTAWPMPQPRRRCAAGWRGRGRAGSCPASFPRP